MTYTMQDRTSTDAFSFPSFAHAKDDARREVYQVPIQAALADRANKELNDPCQVQLSSRKLFYSRIFGLK
ncbi:hypothetical protein GUITHDRAFT_118418 [Guillardia theta CCMP2712]|uniref:Uncharacterized protein n=1 Tax=Guillardia theta (strain CCMP2712) TaxID=905079 RepID=L1IGP9_GUITC|nr:hypothetical protein GUITHDRAFT_118418 [Guillardia theta CCMP2712]EKX35398.1 hypothetical protein GUITHDRAFT_118418 [Guillardia theta CCMP2712]|eukprot:XP_005822378.1 hypothetical protein GUITHDRAFT_118418 [Guillardia theta CCMP2712]